MALSLLLCSKRFWLKTQNAYVFVICLNLTLKVSLKILEDKLNSAPWHECDAVNQQFDKFYDIFKGTVDKLAPLKNASRKEKRLHAKPWLTSGLLKSVKHKKKIFTNVHKNPEKQALTEHKRYRNILNRAIKSAKEIYYKETIEMNKNNQGKIWDVINEVASMKKNENYTYRTSC